MTQMMQKKKQIDWEAIERKYRAGVFSLREIGKQHSVSDTAIRKKAKIEGWERDLTARVHEQVRATLVRADNRMRTEKEIVAEAASAVVQIVREHRSAINRQRSITEKLLAELSGCGDDLRTKAGINKQLSDALKTAITLEREAFGIGSADQPFDDTTGLTDDEIERRIAELEAKAAGA